MLDITGMLAESLEAITNSNAIDYNKNFINYNNNSYKNYYYDYYYKDDVEQQKIIYHGYKGKKNNSSNNIMMLIDDKQIEENVNDDDDDGDEKIDDGEMLDIKINFTINESLENLIMQQEDHHPQHNQDADEEELEEMMEIKMKLEKNVQLLKPPPNKLLEETIILLPKEEEIILPNDNRNNNGDKNNKRHVKIISKSVSQEFNKRPSSEQPPMNNYYLSYRPSYPPTKAKSSYYKNNLDHKKGRGDKIRNDYRCDDFKFDSKIEDDDEITFENLINFDEKSPNNNNNTSNYLTVNHNDKNNNNNESSSSSRFLSSSQSSSLLSNFDVIIKVGSGQNIKKFKSHSVILSKRSSYFRTALSNHWSKKDSNNSCFVFDKPNISPKVFTSILRYLYFDSVKLEVLDIPTILEILIASDELVLSDFVNEIQTHFIYLDIDKLRPYIVRILLTTFYNPSFEKLFNYILKILVVGKGNLRNLLLSPSTPSASELHMLTEDMIVRLLEEFFKKESDIESEEIWELSCEWGIQRVMETTNDEDELQSWGKNEYIKFYGLIHNLLRFIKFSNISRNFYFENILPHLKYWGEFQSMILENENNFDHEYEFINRNTINSRNNTNLNIDDGNDVENNNDKHENYLNLDSLLKTNVIFNYYLNTTTMVSMDSGLSNIILNDSDLINHLHVRLLMDCIEKGNRYKKSSKNNGNNSSGGGSSNNNQNFIKKLKKLNNFSSTFFKKLSSHNNNCRSSDNGNSNNSNNTRNNKTNDIGSKKLYKFNLLFRMTRDGLDSYNRNKFLFNNGPTLVIAKIHRPKSTIKNNNNNNTNVGNSSNNDSNSSTLLVGGYNPIGFDYNNQQQNDNIMTNSNNHNNKKDLSSQLSSQVFVFSFGANGNNKECGDDDDLRSEFKFSKINYNNNCNNVNKYNCNGSNNKVINGNNNNSWMTIKFDNIGPTFGYLTVNLAEKSCEFSTRYFFDDGLGCLSKNEILECEIFHIDEI